MRRLFALLLLLIAVPAHAGTVRGPDFAPRCAASRIIWPSLDAWGYGGALFATGGINFSTFGRLICTLAPFPCQTSAPLTKLAFEVTTAAASSQAAVAVYSADGTTKLLDSGITAGTPSGVKSATGLAPVTLTPGQEYLICAASSVNSTLNIRILQEAGSPAMLNQLGQTRAYTSSGASETTIARFNAACAAAPGACTGTTSPFPCCTGAGTGPSCPTYGYTCCTGTGTGTCTGMPTSTGALSAGNYNIPLVVVAE